MNTSALRQQTTAPADNVFHHIEILTYLQSLYGFVEEELIRFTDRQEKLRDIIHKVKKKQFCTHKKTGGDIDLVSTAATCNETENIILRESLSLVAEDQAGAHKRCLNSSNFVLRSRQRNHCNNRNNTADEVNSSTNPREQTINAQVMKDTKNFIQMGEAFIAENITQNITCGLDEEELKNIIEKESVEATEELIRMIDKQTGELKDYMNTNQDELLRKFEEIRFELDRFDSETSPVLLDKINHLQHNLISNMKILLAKNDELVNKMKYANIKRITVETEQMKKWIKMLVGEIKNSNRCLQLATEEIKRREQELQQLKQEKDKLHSSLEQDLHQRDEIIEKLTTEKEALQESLISLKQEIQDSTSRFTEEKTTLEGIIEKSNERQSSLEQDLHQRDEIIEKLTTEKEALQESLISLKQEKQDSTSRFNEENTTLERIIEESNERQSSLEQDLHQTDEIIETLTTEKEALQERCFKIDTAYKRSQGLDDNPVRERVQDSSDADDEGAANIAALEEGTEELAENDDQQKTSAETDIAALFQKHKKPFLAVAAIDFGTTYSGCAFSTVVSFKQDPLKTVSIEIDNNNAVSYKTPTVLLLTPEGRFHSFGSTAENKYLDLAVKDEADKWYYFNKFKTQLYEEKVLHSNMLLKDINGKKMKAHLVYALCIEHMKDKIMERLTAAIDEFTDEDVHWVLTVPAIWKEQARQFMIKAAETAGIQKNNLTLPLEPEAAAMCCKYIALEKKKHKEKVAELKAFETNARFMVVDLRGGTIDINVSQVLPTGQLKEIYNATGEPWGGNYINKTIVKKMRDIVSWDVMRKFREEDLDEYLELVRNIEQGKRSIKFNKDLKFKISNHLAKKISIKNEYTKGMKKGRKSLTFSAELIQKIFCSSVDKMTKHVENVLANKETKGVSTILLVGGYAAPNFVQRAFCEKFESKFRIIIPLNSDMVVLKGAVIIGHIQEAVVDRMAK